MAEVILETVTKVYPGGVQAVRLMDLHIRDREFIVLVGPSGCGKSTLLRMVAGLEDVTNGTIRIGQRVVNDVPPKDRDIAMVFQNYALYPHMTIRKNLEFGLMLRKVPQAEIDRLVNDAAEILGITPLLERRPKQLSGGQRQRVAVGRAIVRHPAVFLFDEPLSNLDAKLRVQMRAEIKQLQQRLGTTAIYVTHDQVEAMTMGHRIAVMRDGRLQQVAAPQDLYERPANTFVASFLGSPGMNLVPGSLEGGVLFVDGTRIELPGGPPAVAGAVTVGVRPEAASLDAGGIPASVILVEQLGAETHVICALADDARVVVRQEHRAARPDLGESVAIRVDPLQLHFFDTDTGARLELGR